MLHSLPNRHHLLRPSTLLFFLLCLSCSSCRRCAAFSSFPLRLPWMNLGTAAADVRSSRSPSQDKIVIFGGTGGVGQLITQKLLQQTSKKYNVCVVARNDVATARRQLLGEDSTDNRENLGADGDRLEVVEMNLVGENKASDEMLKHVIQDATAIVISIGTTAFPTQRWSNGNTPQAIDQDAVSRIVNLAADVVTSSSSSKMKRIVLLTSIGVYRTKQMPFIILNLFGVLDAKRSGEEALKAAASRGNFSYSIIRPGRLVGGPYSNIDLAKLFQIEGGAENGVTIQDGDELLGDCKRDACAEAVIQCLESERCRDVEFSIVSNEERAWTTEEWSQAFLEMRQ